MSSLFVGKFVIVRTKGAGVWAGTLRSTVLGDKQIEVVLERPRRLYSWTAKRSITLSSCAAFGIDTKESKVVSRADPISLLAEEVLAVTPEAQASILATPDVQAEVLATPNPEKFVQVSSLKSIEAETFDPIEPSLEQLHDGGYVVVFNRERYGNYVWIGRLRSRAGCAVVISEARRIYPDLWHELDEKPEEVTAHLHRVAESGDLSRGEREHWSLAERGGFKISMVPVTSWPCPTIPHAVLRTDTVLPMTPEAYEKVMAMPDIEAIR
jgi:hypothetical protein